MRGWVHTGEMLNCLRIIGQVKAGPNTNLKDTSSGQAAREARRIFIPHRQIDEPRKHILRVYDHREQRSGRFQTQRKSKLNDSRLGRRRR